MRIEGFMRIERWVVVVGLFGLSGLLAGCAAIGSPSPESPESPDHRSSVRMADRASDRRPEGAMERAAERPGDRLAGGSREAGVPPRPGYALYRAGAVGLAEVVDDGRATFLAFEVPPAESIALFDQDGRPLARVTAGRVTAVDGLFGGILVRDGERAGFIAPDPGMPPAPAWSAGSDHARARLLLDRGGQLMQAMQRALGVVRSGESAAVAAAAAAPGGAVAMPMPPRAVPAAPLAIANAASARVDKGLVRVFFASASRTIVAPEDGLSLLLRNAPQADEIRVTGFTDAAGAVAVNETLARARADAVLRILLRQGIASERIVVRSVAASDYIAGNDSDRGRALNRRAEIELRRLGAPLVLR